MTGAPGRRVVTVAIPTRNAGEGFAAVLTAVAAQRVEAEVELLVADTASTDGTVELARAAGAEVIPVPAGQFSHGGTRNLLMERARGDVVAFLTQDAEPAGPGWLHELLAGFDDAPDVGLVCGPYRPRPDADPTVRRELESWFARMPAVVQGPLAPTPGPEAFFSDANGAVRRAAWRRVPFRRVAYAEDRVLAADMLAAGMARVYRPAAAVLHSHAYGPIDLGRRAFDEARALREVYDHRAPADPRTVALEAARATRADLAWMREAGHPFPARVAWAPHAAGHHLIRGVGSALGARADRLPAAVRGRLSLEGRTTFAPVGWDDPPAAPVPDPRPRSTS